MSGRPECRRAAAALLICVALAAGCSPEPSFDALVFPGATGSAEPRLTSDLDGAPLLSWIEPEDEGGVLRYARFEGVAFQQSREIVRSERMLVSWADFPAVTPITPQLWFAYWLRKRPQGFAYDAAMTISRDGGASWSDAGQLNDDDAEAEHGFVSVIAWDERFGAFWLDGRELATASLDGSGPLPGTSLRLATFDRDGVIAAREIVDSMVCDCCQPDVALTSAGPIVIYRDRTEDEIRDVVVRRHVGGTWSAPVNLGNEGWHIEGCPVNGPVVAAREDDVVAAWFTAASNSSRVRFARSVDAGASFRAAVDVDVGRALGQPAIVLDADGRALVSWWRRGGEGGIDLMLRRFERDDSAGEAIVLAHEDIGLAGDVPQLIAAGRDHIVAWTTVADGGNVRLLLLRHLP
jgi:hypothetical protein